MVRFESDSRVDVSNLTQQIKTNFVGTQLRYGPDANNHWSHIVDADGNLAMAGVGVLGGAFSLTPAAGKNVNVVLSGAGDFAINTDDLFVDTSTGNVAVGGTVPTAALHLRAGTAAANTAPLKLTSGALLTAAEAGAVEFLTDAFYVTVTTGAVRQQLVTDLNTVTMSNKTFVTPALGTPISGVATNLTGTAAGLTAGTVTTNANTTGDVTSVGNVTTLATVNANVGSFGSSTSIPTFTVNGKGLITAASGNVVIAPAGTLTGTILNSTVVTSSLTTIGTLVAGSVPAARVTAGTFGTGAYVMDTSLSVPSIITASGALGITPAAGSNLNVVLSATGDFAVNTSQLYVDTSTGFVGIGETLPEGGLHISANAAQMITLNRSGWDEYAFRQNSGSGLEIYNVTDIRSEMFFAGDGKVGVGTTGPTAKLDVSSDIIRLRTAKTPATAGAAGNQGDIAWDAGFLYVCVATNTWQRVAHATWV